MARQITVERFLKATDVRSLVTQLFPDKAGAISIALQRIESYAEGAAAQQQRIDRAHRLIELHFSRQLRTGPSVTSRRSKEHPISKMSREIHFYLTCWRAVDLNLRLVLELTQFRGIRQVLRPHRQLFERYTTMRDHLEHFDERLRRRPIVGARRGRGRAEVVKQPNDFGNFSRSAFSFGGERVDISRKSLLTLRVITQKALLAVKNDAWTKLVAEHPQAAQRLMHSFRRDLQIQRLLVGRLQAPS